MGILGRQTFREITTGALLGTLLFTFVLFLQRLGRLFEHLVNSTASLEQVGALFGLILPPALTFTIPVGVLVGVLLAVSRMSSDGEIIAMRAAGIAGRRILYPVVSFAVLGMALTACASCILNPWATRKTYHILNQMAGAQITAEIRPRVFEEQFPNRILYVGDVIPGPVVQWNKVFIADLTPPHERRDVGERGEGPRITIARRAIAAPDLANHRIQLSLIDGSSFEVGKEASEYFSTYFPKGEQALDAPRRSELKAKDFSEMDTIALAAEARRSTEAGIEFHRRLALPAACLILAALAVPLGASWRRGGKSAAFVMTVTVAFLYYMSLISLIALARQGSLSAALAVWTPNGLFAILAILLLLRLERPVEHEWAGWLRDRAPAAWNWLRGRTSKLTSAPPAGRTWRFPILPLIIDTYVLSAFLYYFVVLLASFVLMTHVFTFFELLGDIIKNGIPFGRVGAYHLFLTPKLIYDCVPVSVLAATLITFGLLSRSNEVTAMKACGVSVYRLSIPVLATGLLLSGLLFAFDYYVVPEANLIQDAIRNEIKGRPVQTYLRPDRKWIVGAGSWIYYYKHFDPSANVMVGVSVYELDPESFRLRRHVWAESAHWDAASQRWVFQNGWMRLFQGIRVVEFENFLQSTATFPEFSEPPNYFLKEVKQDKQMNFHQLAAYINELRQSGFDTLRLQVQYQKKFAVPLFALIMAMISTPFAFLTGNRGAMAPVGISLGIAICYWATSQLFEQMGNVGQLPAELAAWSPDAIFSLASTYFFMRLRS